MSRLLRDHYLRIDGRSLGIFRIAFGIVLLADLCRRWQNIPEFYSNEGLLPNHNHLFNLRGKQDVWSVYHAFSSPGENRFAFFLTGVVFLAFLLGYRTRVFQVLSLALLVSLTSRNILLESSGNYLAIALLGFTVFLPLGTRLSLDALRQSLSARDEKLDSELNDRGPEAAAARPVEPGSAAAIEGVLRRPPGWSPTSIAAFAVLVQIALVFLCTAIQQRGAWRDGSALHYALHVERWVSSFGAGVRGAPPGVLKALTYLLWISGFAIPALIFLPVARRAARAAAAGLIVVVALLLGTLFDFGLYAWSLLAAAPLVLSTEVWETLRGRARRDGTRIRTVIYDADCGLCLWLCRVLKRIDSAEHLAFQGNDGLRAADDTSETAAPRLVRRNVEGKLKRVPMPEVVTADLAETTVVVVDSDGRVFTRGRAVTEVVRALPFGRLFAPVLALPGIAQLLDLAYDVVAKRRMALGVALGFEACGLPLASAAVESDGPVAPASQLARKVAATVREVAAAAVFVAMLAQTAKANALPAAMTVPQGKVLAAIASWPRMLAKWNVMAPSPPVEDGWFVVDGQTRAGKAIDPLTGREPQFDLGVMRGTGMGQLWNDYLWRIRDPEWSDFQKAFKDYLAKGGPEWTGMTGENQIVGLDAYWVKDTTSPPGGGPPVAGEREKLFTHSRGGGRAFERLPGLRPEMRRPPVQE